MSRIIPLILGAVAAVAVAFWSAPSHAQSLTAPSPTNHIYGIGQPETGTVQGGHIYSDIQRPRPDVSVLDLPGHDLLFCFAIPQRSGIRVTICE